VEEQIRRIIRDERAKDPLITVAGLEKALQKRFDRGFSHQYVSKIADKVAREGLIDADRTQIEERMNFTRENYRMMRDRLLRIIYWNPEEHPGERGPLNRDVIEAAKNIVMMDLALLQAEIANGMYKKPIDEIAKEIRYDPLPDEVRTVIIAAWTLLIASRVTGSSWQTRPSQPTHPRTFIASAVAARVGMNAVANSVWSEYQAYSAAFTSTVVPVASRASWNVKAACRFVALGRQSRLYRQPSKFDRPT
jgi:hypothetical protein